MVRTQEQASLKHRVQKLSSVLWERQVTEAQVPALEGIFFIIIKLALYQSLQCYIPHRAITLGFPCETGEWGRNIGGEN